MGIVAEFLPRMDFTHVAVRNGDGTEAARYSVHKAHPVSGQPGIMRVILNLSWGTGKSVIDANYDRTTGQLSTPPLPSNQTVRPVFATRRQTRAIV